MPDVVQFAILGLSLGGIYALIAASVVLIHRGSGVLNFAAAAVGMFGTFVSFKLHLDHGWAVLPALLVGIAVSSVIGGIFHIVVMHRLAGSAMTTRIVATLGLMTTLIGTASLIFAPTGAAIGVPTILPSAVLDLGSGIYVGLDRILVAAVAVAVIVLLILMQHRTRFGLVTSAVAEDPVIAASMGWSPSVVAGINWVLGSALGMIAIFLVAPLRGLDVPSLSLLVIPGMASALVGRFQSFPLMLLGAMVLGVSQSEANRYLTNPGWATAVPLLVIVAVLVVQGTYIPSKEDKAERVAGISPGRVNLAGLVFGLAAVILILLIPLTWITALTITLVLSLVVLSVVVVTGLAGQLSLAQLSLGGVGAFFTAVFVIQLGLPMWAAVVLAALATAGLGIPASIPALRARGSSLAIASLALATVIDALILQNPDFATLIGPEMSPLSLFGFKLDAINHPRRFALLALAILALCLLAVSNLRRGASGRRMLAMRANERAAMALGISVARVKVFAFALAALLAGLAGGLMQAQLSVADYTSAFRIGDSINAVLGAVLGGLGWPSGAVVGGVMTTDGAGAQTLSTVVPPGNWLYVIGGLSALLVVLQSPNGLVPLWVAQGKAVGRRITGAGAQRGRVAESDRFVALISDALPARRKPVTVQAKHVTVRFGDQLALDDVSIELRPGEILGLIGPNGAGKSTLIDAICGFQGLTSGTILVDGQRIDALPPWRRARLGLSRSFQSLELFEDMTILDNLRVASDHCPPQRYVTDLAWPRRSPLSDVARTAMIEFRLIDVAARLPHEVDYARRRLLAIARAMAGDPSAVLLDEPAAGLDETEREELSQLIKQLAREWTIPVLLIEHDVEMVFAVCDRVTALDEGRVIAHGTPNEVRNHAAVIASYLGAPADVPSVAQHRIALEGNT